MKHTTSTDLRKSLSAMMDRVNEDHEPVLVTRAKGKPVVMISLDDYQAMDETAYLLASPANARALRDAIARVERGEGVTRTLADLEAMDGE
ncbi:type II toxin-antitoxin system Phd/YefM family antitoxin [Roseovarius nitratireducens]|uniref:type II toxin-antitoxin system Phd/YefM family antitoxin n=1 Tax=Roseovarius nitratireducens TaxID=2044597 RepID=UPI000CE23DF9|nr:type II toxin-antitoxin system prevent-host-death family antitoxin [Roseovarius nitratireducens]